MDKVIAADGEEIAIARGHHHTALGSGQLQTRRKRNGPAVGRVEGVQVQVAGHPAGTANPRDHRHIVQRKTGLLNGCQHTPEDRANAATGAPDVRNPVGPQQGIMRVRQCGLPFFRNHAVSFNTVSRAVRILSGRMIAPPAWGTSRTGQRPPAQRSSSNTICP